MDDAIGKPSGKTYVDHASDTAKPYLDEASKQVRGTALSVSLPPLPQE